MAPLKLGMVGGGQGAFIGGVHRMAALLDGCFDLVAGAFSSDAVRAHASAAELGIDGDTPVVTPFDDCVLIMPTRRTWKGQTAVRLGRYVN